MRFFKKLWPYFATPLLAIGIFAVYFKIWEIDLGKPIFNDYHFDSLLHMFFAKNIIDNGWFLVNDLVGLPKESFYLYDFPLQGGSFNFLIFKFFAQFSSNPFLVLNCYYIATFALIAFTAFVALRALGVSVFSALLVSILYDFIFYHFQRATFHALLSNYMAIPLVIMVAVWIMDRKIKFIGLDKSNKYHLQPNKFFFIAVLVSVFVATNDVYYAFHACVIFMMAYFIEALQSSKFFTRNLSGILVVCLAAILTLLFLYYSSFQYWIINGNNQYVANRSYAQNEFYALRIVDLLIPSSSHYIEYLANIREFFKNMIAINDTVAYEREATSLGIIGSFGFLFLIFWFFVSSISKSKVLEKTIDRLLLKANEINLISNLSVLNLFIVLFATVGGFVMILIPSFPMLRGHARFSTSIAFISLFMVAIISDKILQKYSKQKILVRVAISFIAVLGLFDQIGNPNSDRFQNLDLKNKFTSDQNFITQIEEKMPSNSHIFMMPAVGFPEFDDYGNMIGYLHSKKLLWSYPVITNRKSYIWQKEITSLKFEDFILAIKKEGFKGVFINRKKFAEQFSNQIKVNSGKPVQIVSIDEFPEPDWEKIRDFEAKISKISKVKLYSKDLAFSFYGW